MENLTVSLPGATISDPRAVSVSDPTIKILGADRQPILTVHPDGRVVLNRPELADEAAHVFADYVTTILQGRLGEFRPVYDKEPHADHPR